MCRKLFVFALCVCLLLSCLSAQDIASPRSTMTEAIASMRADLQILKLSIANYEQKTVELRILIEQSQTDLQMSQTDLTKQKQLLTECQTILETQRTQYQELSATYQSLSKRYKRSLAVIKYGGIAAIAVIITEGIIIAIQ